ncbi:MAG: ribosome biogenesis GTPase Der, partial [Firmicutes bacterium]|nr:ribosome biogenesis GTPase Der [Bacillota bacterium]
MVVNGMNDASVVLVGRPNVGKSSLFNRMTETRRAIVEDFPGVTRDRLYETTEWNGRIFSLVDTGGIWDDADTLLGMTRQQTEFAMKEADVLVFVVDVRDGIAPADEAVADILRRTHKPVVVAVNKVDNFRPEAIAEFYALGFGEPVPVSAVHGSGVGDLLDAIVQRLPAPNDGEDGDRPVEEVDRALPVRMALAGRPNVGKSSLVNLLSGEERTLVTPIAGTTRDVVDTLLEHGGKSYLLLDTAGLRRPNKIKEELEEKTVHRTLQAIRDADVVLFMLAADEPITAQDQRIAGQVSNSTKACVILLNKADLVKGTTMPIQMKVKEDFKFLPYAKIVPMSVKSGWHIENIWEP